MKTIEEIQQENVDIMIPSGWNFYKWVDENPDTVIAAAVKRVEKLMDFSDHLSFSWSDGKDSTVSAMIAMTELSLRRLRVKYGVDRDGNQRVDPLDKKWEKKNLAAMSSDAEVVFTDSNNYGFRTLQKYGPRGLDLIDFSWMSLELMWQSGVDFDKGTLLSWDPEAKNIWIHDMPTKDQLGGFDVVRTETVDRANSIPLEGLPEAQQKLARDRGIVIKLPIEDLFEGSFKLIAKDEITVDDGLVEAVPNFGRGFYSDWYTPGMHEKDLSHMFSAWSYETSDMNVADVDRKEIKSELEKRYPDISKDVWFLTGNKNGIISSALVSLRAEESLDRRVILSQGEYTTGQYSNAGGVNNASPVFDWKSEDIWIMLANTDWDINDVYERMFQAGIPIGSQRVGSLLNYAATRSIGVVKSLEPEIYAKIVGRFKNVEFMANFGTSRGYYNIGKPKDTNWDGQSHVRPGISFKEMEEKSDRYEAMLRKLGIPFTRKGDVFKSADPKFKNKPWFPLRDWLEQNQIKEGN